ncbi:hypothetical protein MAP00_009257 [Monascus purpureus]|nr:hypothetical protein MAP00_009257 [Monascus purpureus]
MGTQARESRSQHGGRRENLSGRSYSKQASNPIASSSASSSNTKYKPQDQDSRKPKTRCDWCGHFHPMPCLYKNPEKASEHWRRANKNTIEAIRALHTAKESSTASFSEAETNELVPWTSSAAKTAIAKSAQSLQASWYLDSCASFHVTPHQAFFTSYKTLRKEDLTPADYIEDAQGKISKPHGIGTVVIDIGTGSLILRDVRHVPSFNSNLISMGMLLKQGFRIEFPSSSQVAQITTSSGAEFEAILNTNNVFILSDCISPDESSYAFVTTRSGKEANRPGDPPRKKPTTSPKTKSSKTALPIMTWHRRLCHLNQQDLLRLAADPTSDIEIKGSKELPLCEACIQGKQTRQYSKTPRSRMTAPLARVHIDLAGGGRTLDIEKLDMPLPSRTGAKYVMLITDDATRYRWVHYLTERSAAIDAFRGWLQQMKNHHFPAPAYIVSDNEFCSAEWQKTYRQEGIEWQPSSPYSPWQNGVSERSIRILFDRARTLMLDAPHIPQRFWVDALKYASDITNRLPTSTILFNSPIPGGVNTNTKISPSPYKSPLAAWTNSPTSINKYRRWGCPVWVHRHGSDKPINKFDSHSKCCFMIGQISSQQYRVWDPKTDAIFSTNDTIFDEEYEDPTTTPPQATVPEDPSTPNKEDTNQPVEDEDQEIWLRPAKGMSLAYLTASTTPSSEDDTPTSYKQAISHPDATKWQAAMQKEVNQLKEKGCWQLIRRSDLPPGTKVIPGRWVYKKKEIPGTPITRDYQAKARWVIRGNLLDKDFMESYAPVVDENTTRTLTALATLLGWHTRKADAILAFLNGKMPTDKRVFMTQVQGFKEGSGDLVCELRQSLYGLIPSARIWYDTLNAFLRQIGFKSSEYDSGLWIHTTQTQLYVTTHVDDFKVYAKHENDATWFMESLSAKFDIKEVGNSTKYLGMATSQSKTTYTLSQANYAEDVVASFGQAQAHPVGIPMDPSLIIDDDPDPTVNIKEYQRGVGCLTWLATKTRPDLSRTVGVLSQYHAKPTQKAWRALIHAIRYLKGSINRQITYHKATEPITSDLLMPRCYTDSDWGGQLTGNRRSVSGYIFLLAGAPIAWKSRKQTSVALSSNEAEYMALSEASRDALWLRNLINELNVLPTECPPITLYIDNQGAHAMAEAELTTKRSKHIDIRYHYVREKIQDGIVKLQACPTKEQAADGLTKPLRTEQFDHFLQLTGIS